MPAKSSSNRSKQKRKPTAQAAAARRMSTRRGGPEQPKVPVSAKRISQSRLPGETPLTGEDRPARSAGGKKRGVQGRRASKGGK